MSDEMRVGDLVEPVPFVARVVSEFGIGLRFVVYEPSGGTFTTVAPETLRVVTPETIAARAGAARLLAAFRNAQFAGEETRAAFALAEWIAEHADALGIGEPT